VGNSLEFQTGVPAKMGSPPKFSIGVPAKMGSRPKKEGKVSRKEVRRCDMCGEEMDMYFADWFVFSVRQRTASDGPVIYNHVADGQVWVRKEVALCRDCQERIADFISEALEAVRINPKLMRMCQ
jgi:hypothetical protein